VQSVAQFLTTLCCGLFAGAALYVSLVEHPARMECGTQVAVTEFSPSYRRAAVMQALLAVLGFLFSLIAWLQGSGVRWLVGGVLLLSVVPFTLIVIMPTNKALLDASLDKTSAQAHHLLTRWARLHAVRTLLSLLALVLFLHLLVAKG
jgi:uncharacterized membrane protein